MTQESIVLNTTPPYSGAALVDDVNEALQSLGTDFAGPTDPAAVGGVGPYMTWADTANGLLKRRNAAGTDWVVIGKLLVNNSDAANIDYDNTVSGLAATDVQGAIDETHGLLFGVDQTWSNVTGSRALSTTYTNTSGKPKFINMRGISGVGTSIGLQFVVDSNVVGYSAAAAISGAQVTTNIFSVVPVGSTYRIELFTGSSTGFEWFELG